MSSLVRALKAEYIKNKSANIIWLTFIAFALAPVMGGIFILMVQDADAMSKAAALNVKMRSMNFKADWESYSSILTQAIGVGGVLVFGFVASWIFGREYSDGTAKDLLALPVSRVQIINAKFIVYTAWCMALVVSNLLIGILIAMLLHIPLPALPVIVSFISDYSITTILTIALGTPVAFFAIWGKGYLAPLGVVALALVFSQVIAATGYGYFFPWSIPGLFSGAGGEYKNQLIPTSYLVLFITSCIGYSSTIVYWSFSEQSK